MGKKLHGKLLLLLFLFPILVWGQECPSSVSLSSDTGSSICSGATVTFKATPNSGTGPFIFEWKINSTVQAESSDTFVTSALTNGQTVSVTVLSANGTSCSVSNSGSPITVNTNKTPTVNFSIPAGTKCLGQNLTFTANNTDGGSNPNYQWFVDGSSVQSSTSKTFSTNSLSEGSHDIRVILTSTLACVTSTTAEITKSVNISPNANITTPNADISGACLNQNITPIIYTISGSATGATVTGLPPGLSGSTSGGTLTISGSPTSAGNYNYTVTTQGPCGNVSQNGSIEVLKDATISLSSGNNNQEVCQGQSIENISYTIGETGENASVSGLPNGITGSISGSNFVISGSSTQTGTFNYSVFATGNCGDSQTLNGEIIINENITPTITIFSSEPDNEICAGEEVTFTINATNEGSSPSYQWKINGNPVSGQTGATFSTKNLANNDIVTLDLISSENCITAGNTTVTSNGVSTIVNENLNPEVSIEISDSEFCDGDSVTFTATPINGGASPTFQWKVDGNNVSGSGNEFSTSSLTNGQVVSVVMISSETCVNTTSATSNEISTIVNPNLTPAVSISSNDSDNIICAGSSIQFTATSTNDGSNPTYEWFVNGSSVGNNSSTYTTTSLTNGQVVKVRLTSNEECLTTASVDSNEITVQVDNSISGITPSFDITDPSQNSTAICPVTNVTYTVNPIPGASAYNWTYPSGWTVVSQNLNTITLKAGTNAQAGNISVTASNSCGNSQTLSTSVTTGTVVLVDAGPDQTVCLGTKQITLAGVIGGVITKQQDWKWSANVSGGSFSNNGNKLDGIYTLPSTISNNGGTVTITITSIDPAGPCGPKTDSMVITVLTNATISDPTNKNQTVCINNPIDNISFTIANAGTGANVTGLPTGLTASFNAGVYTISGTPTATGTFNYTVNTTGTCSSQQVTRTGIITVNPDNTISDASNKDQTVCINNALEIISFPINSTVTEVTTTGLPAGVSGIINSNNFVISGSPTESGTFDYTVTTTGSCQSATTSGTLTINPDVTINSPENKTQEICINTAIQNIQFNITAPGNGTNVTGLPAGINPNYNNGILTISGTATEAGVFDYIVNTVGDCTQAAENGTITVVADPTASISYSGPFCTSQTGSRSVTLTGTGGYENGTYTAESYNGDGAKLSISSNSGAITPSSSDPGTYTITYSGPDICNPAIATTEVTITAAPFVELSYEGPFCNSDSSLKNPVFSNGVGNYTGGTFSAEPDGLTIDPNTGQINPQSVSPGTYDIFYEINDSASGCETVIVTTKVTITQNPDFTIMYPEIVCSSSEIVNVNLTGDGAFESGTFTATAGLDIDENGSINPSTSTFEEHTVTYTVPSTNGCGEISKTATFTIKEQPVITTNPLNTGVCSNSPASFEVIATGDDLKYQWYKIVSGTAQSMPGETDATLNFSNVTSVDALEYYVIVSGSDTCSEVTSDTVSLNVDEDIVITEPSEDITICEQEVDIISFEFIGHANGSPLTFKWMKNGVEVIEIEDKIVISQSGPTGDNGEYTGTLTIKNPTSGDSGDSGDYYVVVDGPDYFTCSEATSKTFTFRVEALPPAPETTDLTFCLNDDAGTLTADGEPGNEIRWYTYDEISEIYTYIGSDDDIDIVTTNSGTFTYYASQVRESGNGCESVYEPIQITVLNKPAKISEEPLTYEFCFGEEVTEAISITPADGATLNWYSSANGTENIATPEPDTDNASDQNYWVSQTFDTGCESDRTPVTIVIKELPNVGVEIVGGQNTICNGSSVTLNLSGAESYSINLGETAIATTTESTIVLSPTTIGENAYTITGISNGCTNSYNLSIFVDEVSDAGTLTADNNEICISTGTVTLTLNDYLGDIKKWEYKNATTGDQWTETVQTDLSSERTFAGLTETTDFRVTVQNGDVCEESSAEINVTVWQLPEGGITLWAENNERLFLTCENPAPGYASRLNLSGHTGNVLRWEYRGVSDNSWTPINSANNYLTSNEVENSLTGETTAFRAVLINGSCDSGIYSEAAMVSVIEADIKPTPVEVDKEVICIGDEITLSSETGYSSTGGKFEGGAFDQAGLDNNGMGWDFTNPDGSTFNFEGSVNNGRVSTWGRMNPHGNNPANEKVFNANIPVDGAGTMINYRTWSGNAGNKGFALVTGNNSSYMETPVFSLGGLDEAILEWDQAYNLTNGAMIIVEISTDGGATYPSDVDSNIFNLNHENTLYYLVGDNTLNGVSDNFDHFGEGDEGINQMSINLGSYLGQSNLRVRFTFVGTVDGDVWAVDNIEVPEGPQDILLQWYYDEDLNDPDNILEEIGEVNQSTVQFIPRKIGWNDFEVQTRIILDSNGNECQSVDNFETIRVWAFDRYTTSVEAIVGTCGAANITLNATVTADYQDINITSYPTADGYVGKWVVKNAQGNVVTEGFSLSNQDENSDLLPVENPSAIFEAEDLGAYTFEWTLISEAVYPDDFEDPALAGQPIDNSGCPPIINPNEVILVDCVTLDFDGDDDYVDLGQAEYTGSYFIEAWIMPFDRPIEGGGTTDATKGTIISGPGFEIKMEDLPATVIPNTRWYHIAVSNNGNIWIDGVAITQKASGNGGLRTLIGARWNNTAKNTENHFSGWIDELRIWNTAPDEWEIRFMMNQRIKLNGTIATDPIEGEVVPNLTVAGSYLTKNGHNMHLENNGELKEFYDQTWGDLAGYYRLYSNDPDPDNLLPGYFDDALKPEGGYTPDHSLNPLDGRMVNITTDQENTSPTPYYSRTDATWASNTTWLRPDVWDFPNSSFNGTPIDWNIARINHNITSDSKTITMLGLLSETEGKLLKINGDHPITITHYLLLDGNMDLVGDSQLLQDHGSILANISKGWAEIDQEGRRSSFNYNYWTSPHSNQGTDNNSGFMINNVLMDGTDPNNPKAINFGNGYFVADGARTNPITISNEWIWDFRGGRNDDYSDWLHLGSDYMEIVGAGYSMKGTDGTAGLSAKQNYVFRGKPNNGNIPTTDLNIVSGRDFLVGNPYPSAIDANKFIKDNLTKIGTTTGNNENGDNVFNGSLYYWDHFGGQTHILAEYVGGYATWNLSGGLKAISNDWRINATDERPGDEHTPQQFIPVAQGFFLSTVGGDAFGGDIIFKNTQRVFKTTTSDPSVFMQQEEKYIKRQVNNMKAPSNDDSRIKIRLKFESPKKYYRQILVTMDENTTNGFDFGYDAPLIENNLEDMYWYFEDKGYVIQGVPNFEKEQVLPLAIKSQDGGEFTIKIDKTENWPTGKELYLNDKANDSIHDLLASNYIGSTDKKGEISDRFEIVFYKEKAEIPDPDEIVDPNELPEIDGLVGISYSTFTKQVKISNFDMLDVSKVMIFDMGGKLIQEYDELPTEREILLGMRPVRSGIYIVKVFSENGISNKKVVIK